MIQAEQAKRFGDTMRFMTASPRKMSRNSSRGNAINHRVQKTTLNVVYEMSKSVTVAFFPESKPPYLYYDWGNWGHRRDIVISAVFAT
jgi:hypothetical protein